MNNILSTWLGCCPSVKTCELLKEHSYKHDWIARGDIGGGTVSTSGSFFEFDTYGDFMVLQGVWRDVPCPSYIVDEPILYDIIAWHPEHPENWYFLRGECGLVLGERAMIEANLCSRPIQLHKTPFDWLKSGCTGSVLLDDHGLNRLYEMGEVVCEDLQHGLDLEQQLNAHLKMQMPSISVGGVA